MIPAGRRSRILLGSCLSLALVSCQPPAGVRFFTADAYPEHLSDWGLFDYQDGVLRPVRDSMAYTLNTPLFSDYAQKLRTVYLPPGTAARWRAPAALDFPVGTVVSKTFYYPVDTAGTAQQRAPPTAMATTARGLLLETRLLVRQADGWDAVPYVWDGADARLHITGNIQRVATNAGPINYLIPSRNQCGSCHATDHASGAIQPIGLRARHLNRSANGSNQIAALIERGWLQGAPTAPDQWPRIANAADPSEELGHRALSYLDINCGHCHSPAGPAKTSALWLDYPHTMDLFASHSGVSSAASGTRQLGVCKRPIASGRGSGGRRYDIVPGAPAASILSFRMATTDPASMMPELGRSLIHAEGAALIDRWIKSLTGVCR